MIQLDDWLMSMVAIAWQVRIYDQFDLLIATSH